MSVLSLALKLKDVEERQEEEEVREEEEEVPWSPWPKVDVVLWCMSAGTLLAPGLSQVSHWAWRDGGSGGRGAGRGGGGVQAVPVLYTCCV